MIKRNNFIWTVPLISIIIIFTILPLFISLKDAFINEGNLSFDSFRKIFSDKLFIHAYVNSIIYALVTFVSVSMSLYLAFSIIGITNKYLRDSFSTIIFLQYIFLGLAISSGYIFIFKTDYGLFNIILNIFGISNISFLNNPKVSIWTVSFVSVITSLPFLVTVFTFRGLTYINDKEVLISTNNIDVSDWIVTKSILINMFRFILLTTYFMIIQGFLSYPIGLYSGDLNAVFVANSQSLVCYINRCISLGNYSNASACSIISIISIVIISLLFYMAYYLGRKYV